MCSFINKRIQSELDAFFSELHSIPKDIRFVTSSAFTQCRDKILYTAFSILGWKLVEFFYNNFSYKRYFGMRLIAIDGTVLTLPRNKATVKEFGENCLSNNRKWIKAQVSFACDVLNNICTDADIKGYRTSEGEMALKHLEKLGASNLYIFDRGYFGRDFLYQTYATGNQFCFRVSSNACSEVIAFIKSEDIDIITEIQTKSGAVKVRLTKVVLDTGELEYLVTSLFNQKKFSILRLKELYHYRWGVEEQYKDKKYALSIENYLGKKVNSIKQEFFANILTYNLSMMSCKSAIDKKSNKKKKKYKYATNKRALLAKVKQCFVSIFFSNRSLKLIIENITISVAKESVPIKEGRKYERSKTFKVKRKYANNYTSAV